MVRASLYNIINTELGRPVDASTVGRHGILSSNFLNHASESLILWNGQHMDATSGSTQEQTIIDEMAQRAASLHALWREVRAGNVGQRQFDASVNAWIANDGAAFREMCEARSGEVLRQVSQNAAQCPPYADLLTQCDPELAEAARPETELRQVSALFSELANLLPEKVKTRALEVSPALQAVLRDPARMRAIEGRLAQQLHWIDRSRIDDVHSSIASAYGRDDAHQRLTAAAIRREQPGDQHCATDEAGPARDEEDAHRVANFIAANKGLLSWKIRSNVQEGDPSLKAVLADGNRLQKLDALISKQLAGIHPAFIADIQAIIASELRHPDATDRATRAAALHRSPVGPAPEAPGPATPEPPGANPSADEVGNAAEPAPSPPLSGQSAPDQLPRPEAAVETDQPNGFSPGGAGTRAAAVPVGDLLERMTYTSRPDGTVLYAIDQRPAFIDHGDRLLMVAGANDNEQAILGALLLACEKYRGSFEITGSAEFTRQAVAVMLKYRINASLKNAAQETLLRRMEQEGGSTHPVASPEQPVAPTEPSLITVPPIPPEAKDAVTTPNAPPSSVSADATGTVVRYGSAPYLHRSGNAMSFYVTLEGPDGQQTTTWGLDLAHAIRRASAKPGDEVVLRNLGRAPDQVMTPVFDAEGRFTGTAPARSRKTVWAVVVTKAAPGNNAAPIPVQPSPPGRRTTPKAINTPGPHISASERARRPARPSPKH